MKQKLEVRKAKRAERQKSVDDTARKKAVRNTIVSVRPRIPGLNKRVRLSGMNEDRLKFVMENSTHWQCRLFLTMEYPKYSFWSRCIQMILIMFICLSVFLLFSETLTSFHNYSESTELCGKVLQIYCNSKYDPLKDPGCFVHEWDPSINQIRPTLNKLKYDCDSDDCFANGYNFGSGGNVTCGVHSTLYDETNPVFQDEADLRRAYGYPTFITSRYEFQRIMPVCQRVECSEEVSLVRDANLFWLIGEFTVNIIFSIEFILRLLGSVGSARYFFMDYLNWFDISALLPFYIEVIGGLTAGKTLYQLDFTIISSAPLPIILIAARSFKVLRLFKLLRHFTASKVLVDTARLGWKPMAAILMMLVFFTIVFAVIFFELERGTACYVGDDDCEVPELVYYSDGQRIVLDKYGDESKISNVFYGVWFSFITLTSTGYGDIVPVTNIGQGFCVILIILGAMYMSMPLTVAASTFSHVHEQYERLHGRINEEELQNKRLAQKHLQFTIKLGVKKSLMSLYEKTNDFLELIELKQKYKDRELDEQLNLALIDVLEDAKHTVPTVEDSLEHYIRAELAIARLEKSVNVVG